MRFLLVYFVFVILFFPSFSSSQSQSQTDKMGGVNIDGGDGGGTEPVKATSHSIHSSIADIVNQASSKLGKKTTIVNKEKMKKKKKEKQKEEEIQGIPLCLFFPSLVSVFVAKSRRRTYAEQKKAAQELRNKGKKPPKTTPLGDEL